MERIEGNKQPVNERMKEMSPEEIRQQAKERVAKGVAAVSGSLEGYTQETHPELYGEATRKVAETLRETASTVREEFKQGLPGEPVFKKKQQGVQGGEPQDLRITGESTAIGAPSGSVTYGATSIEPVGGMQQEGGASRLGERASEAGQQLGERARETGKKLGERSRAMIDRTRERSRESLQMSKEYMRSHSPEEIRQEMKDRVAKSVASVEGTLEGVKEQVDPKLPSEAVHKVGESVREAGGAIREEVKKGREDMSG